MDTTVTEIAPDLIPTRRERLRSAVAAGGPAAAADDLIAELRRLEDYGSLFYALLLKKRVELGASPFPSGAAADLPPDTHEAYEDAIRAAGREVGRLFLAKGDLPRAWTFFRMLGEPEPVREALEKLTPGPDDDVYPLIELAWQNGLLPKKGFDFVLDRNGICSAITMVSSSELNQNPDLRDYCVARLVRALHEQLTERLQTDLAARGDAVPPGATIPQLLAAHPDLMGDDVYHIDTSHLASVVQMALYLQPGPDLDLARDLCEYGRRLAPAFRGGGEAPFDETYDDYLAYLNVLAGKDVEAGLARFQEKGEREAAEGATYAAQVYVNLLVRAGREKAALAAARKYLLTDDERNLVCPGVVDLAKRVGDYTAVADAAEARGDPVLLLAGLIAGRG